ncbi:MAG: hypothetical protein NT116_00905, partial [Candidatus Parcubacteria bacterium]|nr:hypothetical protein [Candidatus Parcubacteria bacterium]
MYYAITIFSFIVIFSLGLRVLFANYKNKINLTFFVIILTLLLWLVTNFIIDSSRNLDIALFFSRLAIIGPVIMAPLWYYFSIIFPVSKSIKTRQLFFILLTPILFLILTPTRFNVESVWLESWGINFKPGILYLFLIVHLLIFFSLTFINLIKSYKINTGMNRMQLLYVMTGLFIAVIVGLISSAILPLMGYG